MFEGRSSYTVVRASIQNYFREVQEELEATYYGCYFLEFADYYCQENNDEREMLKLLYQSLRALTSAAYDKRLVRFIFELKAMAVNGEAPNVFSCVRCGEKENLRWFMTRRGGCICETCKKRIHHRRNPAGFYWKSRRFTQCSTSFRQGWKNCILFPSVTVC